MASCIELKDFTCSQAVTYAAKAVMYGRPYGILIIISGPDIVITGPEIINIYARTGSNGPRSNASEKMQDADVVTTEH